MWFLVKAAFWFTVVLLLLPLAEPAKETASDPVARVNVGAGVEAAASALDDLTGLCARRPDVCRTGGETLSALGIRARDGARVAYQLLDGQFGADASGDVITGTVTPAAGGVLPEKSGARDNSSAVPVPAPRPLAGPATVSAYLPRPYSPPIP